LEGSRQQRVGTHQQGSYDCPAPPVQGAYRCMRCERDACDPCAYCRQQQRAPRRLIDGAERPTNRRKPDLRCYFITLALLRHHFITLSIFPMVFSRGHPCVDCCELRGGWGQRRSDLVGAMVLMYFIPLSKVRLVRKHHWEDAISLRVMVDWQYRSKAFSYGLS